MTAILLALIGGGNCYPQLHVKSYVAQQVYAQPVVYPLYVASDSQNAAARLKATEDAILKLTSVVEQQNLLLQQGGGQLLQTQSKYEAAARRILQRSCVSCHNQTKAEGDVDLTGEIGVGLKLLAVEMVAAEEMPPKKPLSAEDVQTLAAWSREDKAAVREYLRGQREAAEPPPLPGPELK